MEDLSTSMNMEDIPTGQFAFFPSKDIMLSSIHAYHLKILFEFGTKVSDSLRYYTVCKFELTCVLSFRCKSFGSAWKIYKLVGHTCKRDLKTFPAAIVSSRSISEYVMPSMMEDGFITRPHDIQGQLQRDFNIDLKC